MEKISEEKINVLEATLEAALAEAESLRECTTEEEVMLGLQECSNLASAVQEIVNPLLGLD